MNNNDSDDLIKALHGEGKYAPDLSVPIDPWAGAWASTADVMHMPCLGVVIVSDPVENYRRFREQQEREGWNLLAIYSCPKFWKSLKLKTPYRA